MRSREGLRRTVLVVAVVAAVGAVATGWLPVVLLGFVVAAVVLVVVPLARPAITAVLVDGDEVVLERRDGPPLRWSRREVGGLAVRGRIVLGVLVPPAGRRCWVGSSVVVLDPAGRVIVAPSAAWVSITALRRACDHAGLRWVGVLPFDPVPAVPLPATGPGPDPAAPSGPVADDPLVARGATAARRRAGRRAWSCILVGLLLVGAAVPITSWLRRLGMPLVDTGYLVPWQVGLVCVALAWADRVPWARSGLGAGRARWAEVECLVLNRASWPAGCSVLPLDPASGRWTGTSFGVATRSPWPLLQLLDGQSRQRVLLAIDPVSGAGYVASLDRSVVVPVEATGPTADLALVSSPAAAASIGGFDAWPTAPTRDEVPAG